MFAIKVVIWGLPFLIMGWMTKAKFPFSGGSQAELNNVLQAQTSVHYIDFFLYNAQDNFSNIAATLTLDWLDIFPYLLLGMAAMKGHFVTWVKEHPTRAIKWGSLFIIIGVLIKFLGAYAITNPGYMMFSFTVGGPLLSVGIVLLFFHMMQYHTAQKVPRPVPLSWKNEFVRVPISNACLYVLFCRFWSWIL
ncbi:hypothetical protein AAHB43_14110 [Staphylococcus pseudintermedius]